MVSELGLKSIILLAAADSVNPCAIAVLALVLIGVLAFEKKRSAVLKAGFAFVLAVFVTYFLYGLILVGLFKSAAIVLASLQFYIYKIFAIFAIILGIFNIKDSIWYKPGGFLTEMPMFLRPKMKKLVQEIKTPRGAFFIGIFVTLFLLPCTIGPYIVASGILSASHFLSTIPWLLIYNVVFVLPMIAITLLIYFEYTTIEKTANWKEQNIRWLHLIAGLILIIIGLLMFFGMI